MQLPPNIQNFITIFLGIIIESLPFVLLGVFVSALVGMFVTDKVILKLIPKNRYISHIVLSLLGIFIPVCQCGNIPVARRLIMQGLGVSQATTFLLASAVVNPITFITTLQAFSSHPSIAIIRILVVFLIANGIGILMSYSKNQDNFLNTSFAALCAKEHTPNRSLKYGLEILQSEFLVIMKILCIGAFIAAATQEFIPKNVLLSIGQNPWLSILALMTLGFIISVCSTVDAFFVLAYSNSFTLGSILSFLIFAPLVDIKMLALMRSMYTTSFILKLSVLIAIISFTVGYLFQLIPIL